jgi:hypothetical protein
MGSILSPLNRSLFPLRGNQTLVNKWYLPTGINSVNVIGAYRSKNNSDYATTLINEANPGVYDLTSPFPPTWDSSGWSFDGTQYLLTGIVPQNNNGWSLLVYGERTVDSNGGWFSVLADNGITTPGLGIIYLAGNNYYYDGQFQTRSAVSDLNVGVVHGVSGEDGAIVGAIPYIDGIQSLPRITYSPGNFSPFGLVIGATAFDTSSVVFKMIGKIYSAVVYDAYLNASQMLEVTQNMKDL